MRSLALFVVAAMSVFAQGSSYQWVRQLGGSGLDVPIGVAADAAGNMYVAGNTNSLDFPLKNAFQARPGASPLYLIDTHGAVTRLTIPGVALIVSAAFSPCDPQAIYAATPTTLFHSEDLGATWQSSVLPTGNWPNSIAVACDQPALPAVFISMDSKLVRSRDLVHWDTLNTGARFIIRVVVDPNVPSTVYARTSEGLARSLNSGDLWQLTGVTTYELNFYPGRPGTIYTSIINLVGDTHAVTSIVPAKSADFGATWTQLTPLAGSDLYAIDVIPDPARPGVLYASGSGLYVSPDDGLTWNPRPAVAGFPLAVDPDTNTIYATSDRQLVLTRDGFQTLIPVTTAPIPVINAIAVSHGRLLIAGSLSNDAFVTKLNSAGEIVFSTYLGGLGDDFAKAMALGPDGSLYVTGTTNSPDFPVTPGAFQTDAPIQTAIFLVKLTPDGALAYSTYFSTSSAYNTVPTSLAVDATGSAFIAGTTSGGLPTTPGSYQPTFKGVYHGGVGFPVPLPPPTNAFVSKFQPDGAALAYSTYLGNQTDTGDAFALSQDGSVFVGGNANLFHLSADGSQLLASTSIGSLPSVTSLVTSAQGFLYALGPAPPGSISTLTQLTKDFRTIATLPLTGAESAKLSLDASGNLLLAGSASPALPTVAPYQGPFSPQTGFLSVVSPDLSKTLFSTFSGDTRLFTLVGASAAPGGSLVIAGFTPVYNSPLSNFSPFPPTPQDATAPDVFVARLTLDIPSLRLDSVENVASFVALPLAANEALYLPGQGFGPNAQPLVDGEPMPVLLRTTGGIVAALPTGFKASGVAKVEVESDGARSNAVLMPVAPTSPGIFSANGSGTGQGYILNADGTRNSPSNPASEGDPITIFMTGAKAESPIAVFIDGFYANGINAVTGPVSGLPGQVYQVSVYVPRPSDFAAQNPSLKGFKMPPTSSVQVIMSGVKSQRGITISLK